MKSPLIDPDAENEAEAEAAELLASAGDPQPAKPSRSWFAGVEGATPPPAPPLLASVATFSGVLWAANKELFNTFFFLQNGPATAAPFQEGNFREKVNACTYHCNRC